MRCRDDHAATVTMCGDISLEPPNRGGIEPGGRLVEQPERRIGQSEPRQRQPAALPRGEQPGRQIGEPLEIDAGQRRQHVLALALPIEAKIFRHAQPRLDRVHMADEA